MSNPRDTSVMTAQEVAVMTRFATSYIYSLARSWHLGDREHGIPCHRVGRSVRFFRVEVLEWLESR